MFSRETKNVLMIFKKKQHRQREDKNLHEKHEVFSVYV